MGAPAWGVSPYDGVLVQKAVQDLAKENYNDQVG